MAIKDYNSTASNNTTISGIGIQGTNAVSNFDGAFRQIMADVANWTDTDTIASAGTTNLSTVEGTYITVSGTTTITAFGTLKSGMFKFLKFDGALTLTHNATSLILPRAANITTVAGDIAAFVSLGSGNWRCLFVERATVASALSDLGLNGGSLTVADDAVGTIVPPANSGILEFWTVNAVNLFSRSYYRANDGALNLGYKGSLIDLLPATTPTGTTGVDTHVSLACNGGNIYIENRSGSSRTFGYTISYV